MLSANINIFKLSSFLLVFLFIIYTYMFNYIIVDEFYISIIDFFNELYNLNLNDLIFFKISFLLKYYLFYLLIYILLVVLVINFSTNNIHIYNNILYVISFFFFFLLIFTFYYLSMLFLNYLSIYSSYDRYFYLKNKNYYYLNMINYSNFDLFSFILLFLVYIVGYLSILALDTRFFKKNYIFIFLFNYFIFLTYIFVLSYDVFTFIFIYELFLLPSAVIVYLISPSRRSLDATKYFLIWTQIGSIIVILTTFYLSTFINNLNFINIFYLNLTQTESYLIFFFFFLGFGIKVPIWPFHFWLTKTHVEAPAGFSMFLSGFLVKTALFGFYKIIINLNLNIDLSFFSNIIILGIIDSSLKMWGQSDLKKLIAYCTIQEMNLIFLIFLWSNNKAIVPAMLFMFMHGILSSLMFYIVECIQKRFKTRSCMEIYGLLNIYPNLSIVIFFMCLLYSGIPGTLKFSNEVFLFTYIFSISPILFFIIIIVCNFISALSFIKIWFNVIFGIQNNNNNTPIDLNIKDIIIISFTLIFMILPTYIPLILV